MTYSSRLRKLLGTSTSTRTVRHRRWIAVRDLEIGMYVCELDRPWEETRFLFQGFRLDCTELLDQVRASCERVQVETEKQAVIPGESQHRSRLLASAQR